jgi:GNAT superfamily N-acetyltransferase
MQKARNKFAYKGWFLEPFTNYSLAKAFDCGDDDLNDFFRNELTPHEKQLLTRTYALVPEELAEQGGLQPVALISFCNDKIPLDRIGDVSLPGIKHPYTYLPSVKIARLGVRKDYRGQGIGTHLLNMTKYFFLTDNRTGCRILTVDAYKSEDVTGFYHKSYFDFITSKDKKSATRTMFYDLIRTELPTES